MKILIIEDEIAMAEAVAKLLENEKYTVEIRNDGNDGLTEALTGIYDAIILDIMLPGKNGYDVLNELRKAHIKTPVLMLSALSETENRIRGLDEGAGYYLTKPFEPNELLACLRVITRKQGETISNDFSYEDIVILNDKGGIECTTTGKFIHVSDKELYLLETLMRRHDEVCAREWLIAKVWGYENDAEYNMLEVYISFLRKKLKFVGSSINIRTARGSGYCLEK